MTYAEARIRECAVRVAACQIKCGAMQVANAERATRGQSLAYTEERFNALASECEQYASEIREFAEMLPQGPRVKEMSK